jgi:D-alanyl-D-alanine carboxypeptidase (penicillin-binding protein 5/6)
MIKGRFFFAIMIATALLLPVRAAAAAVLPAEPASELAAEAACLLDVATGKTLYEKNADKALAPASTTKILTALLLLETAELGEVVQVGKEIYRIGPDSSVAKLKTGDRLTVAELVYALILPSGNDAAYTAAVFVGRRFSGFEHMDIDEALKTFVGMMNRRAKELGAVNSNFVVPDGYDTPGHVSTARDLAIITMVAGKNDFLRQVAASSEYHWQGIRWDNTNRLLQQDYPNAYYPWATGFKTGYTERAGHCLVATAEGGGRELVGVILKSTGGRRWVDMRWLLEYGFHCWQHYTMFVEGRQIFSVPVTNLWGQRQAVKILAAGSWSDLLSQQQISSLELRFNWVPGIVDSRQEGVALKAPICKGQVVGKAVITLENEILGEVDMIAAHGVATYYWWLPALCVFLLVLLAAVIFSRRKRPPAARQAN